MRGPIELSRFSDIVAQEKEEVESTTEKLRLENMFRHSHKHSRKSRGNEGKESIF